MIRLNLRSLRQGLTNGRLFQKRRTKLTIAPCPQEQKFGLGFGKLLDQMRCFDPSALASYDTPHLKKLQRNLSKTVFSSCLECKLFPPTITGTFMPPSNNPDLTKYSLILYPKRINVPAGSRKRPAYVPAGSSKRPTYVPARDVTYLLAKASLVESTKWHRRMAHVNFKNMNKLAKNGLVNGIPSKLFTNDHKCVASTIGKQTPGFLQEALITSTTSLVVTDDFSRFTWVSFWGRKDKHRGLEGITVMPEPHNKNGVLLKTRIEPFIEASKNYELADSNCLPCFDRSIPKIQHTVVTQDDSIPKRAFKNNAEELARLQKQAYAANATAKKHLNQADLAASRNRVPAGEIDSTAGVSNGPNETITPVVKPVPTDAQSLPPGYSLGSCTFYKDNPSPPDLANSIILGDLTSPVSENKSDARGECRQFINQKEWAAMSLYPDGKIAIGDKMDSEDKKSMTESSRSLSNLKGQPKLGLWYPRDSPFVLEAYSDSDYVGPHGDKKSTLEAEPSNPQIVPETITEPDHSHDHESTPTRPTTSTSGAPVNESGPSSDPNIASSSRPHESAPDQFTSTNVEDETMGGSFQTSPPRSTQAPPEGTTSGGAKDLDKLTALSTLVSTLVQKVNTQESELNAHKLLFKEVVGKLVKKVKLLEDKLKVVAASAVPTGGSHDNDIPPSSYIPSSEFDGGSVVPTGTTTSPSADPSNKGKSPLLEEDPPVKERTFRQKEEDRLGEEAARRMYEEEQAELEREREEMQRKRQQDVLNSAKYYTDSDWTDIMGQVHANQGLTADLLGPDVNEDNFAERMVALIAKRRREFAAQRFQDKRNKPMTYAQQKAYIRTFVKNQSSTIILQEWDLEEHVKSFSDDQLKTEFDKIRAAVAELKSLNIKRSLKRPGADLEQPSSKKKEDVEVPSNTASTAQHTASSHKKVGTRKKRLGRKGVHPSHSTIPIEDGDPEAEHKMCIKYASDADSASDDDTPVNLHVVVDCRVVDLWVRLDQCHLQERQLSKDKKAEGVGLVLGISDGLIEFTPEVNERYSCIETVSGLVLHMFVDKKYPLSVNLIERMLDHQLEICRDTVGNELTTAVQLIAFLKKQISDSRRPKLVVNGFCLMENLGFIVTTSRYVVPTGRVKVPAGRYVVPTGKDKFIVSAGRTKVIPTGDKELAGRRKYKFPPNFKS
ncbi:JmjC domain-containing protein [Tanacetum coccineum]|uniref:JmjC domain-containing protein n=1 Tax=Tanacetum coccineum TaxID=301880 RepID=A0ABQ4X7X9_9ASTR